jgi:sulfite exporter TauE/SafE
MCGGLTAALQLSGNNSKFSVAVFHSARITSYALLGAMAGFITSFSETVWAASFFRYLAAFMLIAMGLYIGEWWRGLSVIEKAGAALFQPVQSSLSKLKINSPVIGSAVMGLCWAAMPCGLIYSALAWSATTQQPVSAAFLMFAFGLGTVPAMLAVSLGGQRLQAFLRSRNLKRVIAISLILAGLWTGYITSLHAHHSAEQHSGHSAHDQHSEHEDM